MTSYKLKKYQNRPDPASLDAPQTSGCLACTLYSVYPPLFLTIYHCSFLPPLRV